MLRSTDRKLRGLLHNVTGARNLRRQIARGEALRIVIGSSGVYEPGWIPTDIGYLNLLQPGNWRRFFVPDSIAVILAEHVWEHLTPEEGDRAARICHEFIKPGGYLRIAVPDGYHPAADYQEWVRPCGAGPGAHDHKILYNHESLQRMLANAGFKVRLLEYFDSAGKFQAVDWNSADGMIHRSRRFDERNRDGILRYTSLIVDAHKPARPRP